MQSGRERDARDVLEQALAQKPDDLNTRHNLARLLCTSSDPSLRDGRRAVSLALSVVKETSGRDARALDTLGAAYAELGDLTSAREAFSRGARLAFESGDRELAEEIKAHERLIGARGPRLQKP